MSHLQQWTAEDDAVLGTDTDAKIAELLGRTRGAVKARRFALGKQPRERAKPPEPALPFSVQLGQRIHRLRRNSGLTQQRAAQIAGIPERTWRRYETGEDEPVASRLLAISKCLNIAVGELLSFE